MYEKIKNIWNVLYRGVMCDTRTTTIIVGILVVLVLLLCGCKTTKTTIVDKSEIRDSTSVKLEVWQDSTLTNKEEQKSEIKTDKEITKDNTTITFGEGGGTFNVITGDATNVSKVQSDKQSEKLKEELNQTQIKLNQTQITLQSVRDSIANIDRTMDIQTETEETYQMDWYWFMIIGALLMLIAIVVLRKIPQTSWLLFWI
jgi:FtsZ-interacting cell division protein ZipA